MLSVKYMSNLEGFQKIDITFLATYASIFVSNAAHGHSFRRCPLISEPEEKTNETKIIF